MAKIIAHHTDRSDLVVIAFPVSQSLDEWIDYRVELKESNTPNKGRYTGLLDTDLDTEWRLFYGWEQPESWVDAVGEIHLTVSTKSSATSMSRGLDAGI